MAQRTDVCPDCGDRRTELVVAPGRFYCGTCGLAGPGPLESKPGDQMSIDEIRPTN